MWADPRGKAVHTSQALPAPGPSLWYQGSPGLPLKSEMVFWLRTAQEQPPGTTNRQPLAANRQPPRTATNREPPTSSSHQQPTANCDPLK